jgi:hypothetical protein
VPSTSGPESSTRFVMNSTKAAAAGSRRAVGVRREGWFTHMCVTIS